MAVHRPGVQYAVWNGLKITRISPTTGVLAQNQAVFGHGGTLDAVSRTSHQPQSRVPALKAL